MRASSWWTAEEARVLRFRGPLITGRSLRSVAPMQLAIGHGCSSGPVAGWNERQTDANAGCMRH